MGNRNPLDVTLCMAGRAASGGNEKMCPSWQKTPAVPRRFCAEPETQGLMFLVVLGVYPSRLQPLAPGGSCRAQSLAIFTPD